MAALCSWSSNSSCLRSTLMSEPSNIFVIFMTSWNFLPSHHARVTSTSEFRNCSTYPFSSNSMPHSLWTRATRDAASRRRFHASARIGTLGGFSTCRDPPPSAGYKHVRNATSWAGVMSLAMPSSMSSVATSSSTDSISHASRPLRVITPSSLQCPRRRRTRMRECSSRSNVPIPHSSLRRFNSTNLFWIDCRSFHWEIRFVRCEALSEATGFFCSMPLMLFRRVRRPEMVLGLAPISCMGSSSGKSS
mmetsp:Transcript_29335/g.57133  ORF Transcript_29335/g.57133 Transcript_29335/m.57133 type:complete len:248 (-) Transcript_29335:293-1036(-)